MDRLKSPLTVYRKKAAFWAREIGHALLDLFYPPLCRLCQGPTRQLFCLSCQDLLTPIDPLTRCRHCFRETEQKICRICQHEALLSAKRAFVFEANPAALRLQALQDEALIATIVSLSILQFSHLDWELPDRIAALPPPWTAGHFAQIVEEFARAFGKEAVKEFKLVWTAPFRRSLARHRDDLLEGQTILLLDFGSDLEWLRMAIRELAPAFPKEIRILSLFEPK